MRWMCQLGKSSRSLRLYLLGVVMLAGAWGGPPIAWGEDSGVSPTGLIGDAKRVLFLGDSITHAGYYVELIEARLRVNLGDRAVPQLVNLGLPSETCSGLSEPDHPFPRPNVHERLERALAKVRPDLVFACYGMNDGIYYPLDEARFAAYQRGIRQLVEKVHASGARLILMTPPPFDPLPLRKKGNLLPAGAAKYSWTMIYEDYDRVIEHYGEWLKSARLEHVERVIDLQGPVRAHVQRRRAEDPEYTMSPDGVHLNEAGHRVLADTILRALRVDCSRPVSEATQQAVAARQRLLHPAWVSAVGHLRPGVAAGLPLEEAQMRADKLLEALR